MSGTVPQTVGIKDVICNPNMDSIEHQSFSHNILDEDTIKEDENKSFPFFVSNEDGVLTYYTIDMDENIQLIDFNLPNKDKENILNKELTLMVDTNDDAEYINPPPSVGDYSLDSNHSEAEHLTYDIATTSKEQDVKGELIKVDLKQVDIKVETLQKNGIRKKESSHKKRKLHEISEPLSDENEEKRRIGAINAKNNREKNKALMDHLKQELLKEKEKNKDLGYQLIIEKDKTKIALLEKANCDLKYQNLSDKFEQLSQYMYSTKFQP